MKPTTELILAKLHVIACDQDLPQHQFSRSFSTDVSFLISRIGYGALGIGILTVTANKYCDWLLSTGDILEFVEKH